MSFNIIIWKQTKIRIIIRFTSDIHKFDNVYNQINSKIHLMHHCIKNIATSFYRLKEKGSADQVNCVAVYIHY